jgi:glycosyltransferase involved in cell wall biosynthesis
MTAKPYPSISVALATYNGGTYLSEQLASLSAQTVLPNELVVTDDGSTDDTIEILESFRLAAPFPVRIFKSESRLGYADNFLRAAGLCDSELIAFCDQDDLWMPRKLELCISRFADPGIFLTVHAARIWYGANRIGDQWPKITHDHCQRRRSAYPLKSPIIYPGFAMVFRRTLLALRDNAVRPANLYNDGPGDRRLPHDGWIWFLAASFGEVLTIRDELAWYRQHQTNTIGSSGNAGMLSNLKLSFRKSDYRKIAQIEKETSQIYEAWGKDGSFAFAEDCQYWSIYFNRLSRLHLLRSSIYQTDNGFFRRGIFIARIFLNAGYFGFKSRPTLGLKAMVKDLLLGLFRMIPSSRAAGG